VSGPRLRTLSFQPRPILSVANYAALLGEFLGGEAKGAQRRMPVGHRRPDLFRSSRPSDFFTGASEIVPVRHNS